MRRLISVAPLVLLTVAWAAPSLYSQRGGGHAGSSGHSASSSHGGFAGSHGGFAGFGLGNRGGFGGPGTHNFSPGQMVNSQPPGFRTLPATNFRVPWANEFNGQPRTEGPLNAAPNRNQRFGERRYGDEYGRSGFADGRRHREPYRRDHHHGRDNFIYGGAVFPWWLNSYGYFGYTNFDQSPAWWDYDDSSDAQASTLQGPPPPDSEQDYGAQQPPAEEPSDSSSLPRWPSINPEKDHQPALNTDQQPAPVSVSNLAQVSTPVTLVFKDGRPPEKIHNFLATAGTLYVMDQQRQDIPIAELDLAETTRINRQAGVEFNVPGAPK